MQLEETLEFIKAYDPDGMEKLKRLNTTPHTPPPASTNPHDSWTANLFSWRRMCMARHLQSGSLILSLTHSLDQAMTGRVYSRCWARRMILFPGLQRNCLWTSPGHSIT
jgi:hypothetical protein